MVVVVVVVAAEVDVDGKVVDGVAAGVKSSPKWPKKSSSSSGNPLWLSKKSSAVVVVRLDSTRSDVISGVVVTGSETSISVVVEARPRPPWGGNLRIGGPPLLSRALPPSSSCSTCGQGGCFSDDESFVARMQMAATRIMMRKVPSPRAIHCLRVTSEPRPKWRARASRSWSSLRSRPGERLPSRSGVRASGKFSTSAMLSAD